MKLRRFVIPVLATGLIGAIVGLRFDKALSASAVAERPLTTTEMWRVVGGSVTPDGMPCTPGGEICQGAGPCASVISTYGNKMQLFANPGPKFGTEEAYQDFSVVSEWCHVRKYWATSCNVGTATNVTDYAKFCKGPLD